MEEDTTSPKGAAAKGSSSSDESGGGPKPFEPKVEVKAGAEENEATPDSPMETSTSDIKAKKEEEDSGSDEEKEEKKSTGKEESKAASSGGVTAALVPVTADDDTDEDEDEEETDKPKENNKETTKAQEDEKANQDATNKEKPQNPKHKEKPDYAKGITEVVRIAQGVRALDQDDDEETSSGRKRASTGSQEPSSKTPSGGPSSEAKKARTSAAATVDNASKEEALKKSLRKISRKELESIAAKRVVESLASRSELGQIRTRLQDLEDSRNKWMKKAQARGKMLQDLCTVVKRYIQDVEAEKEGAKPIIITRSVGLQVVDSAAAKKVLVPAAAAAAQMRKPVGMTNGPRGPPHPLQGGDRQSPQQQRALPVSNAQFRANHEVSVHRVPAGSAAGAGGRKVVSPAMVPQQALKRPLAVAPGASPPNLAKRPAMVANMVTPPGVTISPIAAQHARPQQQNINIPVAIPPQVSISRTAAPVTAAVAVRPAGGIQLPKQPVATAQTANKPQPSKNPNSVIDVVDLSDDEDSSGKPAPAARPPPQPQQPVTTVA